MCRCRLLRVRTYMNLASLRNVPVQSICFATYSVCLHFDNGMLISIENDFQFFDEGVGEDPPYIRFPLNHSSLMTIIETTVVDASIDESKTLRLRFSNGQRLVVPKVPIYQTYSIDRVVRKAETEPLR